MESKLNWLVRHRCRCIDRLNGVLQVDSKPSDDDKDDNEDALTYVTDQSYQTPPQEEATLGEKGYLTSRYIEITLRFFKQCVQQVSGRYMLITFKKYPPR